MTKAELELYNTYKARIYYFITLEEVILSKDSIRETAADIL